MSYCNRKYSLNQKVFLILFGMFMFLVLLEGGLRIAGGAYLLIQSYHNRLAMQGKGRYIILCLGESTTAFGPQSYPAQLQEIINRRMPDIACSVINEGLPATNTSDILARLENNLNKYKPAMVIVMMGINDDGLHMRYASARDSRLERVLLKFKTYKLAKLLVIRIKSSISSTGDVFHDRWITPVTPVNKRAISLPATKESRGLIPKSDEERAYIEFGAIYQNQGDYIRAKDALQEALVLNPESYFAYLGLARVLQYQLRTTEAVANIQRAIQINPSYDRGYVELGWLYRSNGNLIEAEAAFTKAVALNPCNDITYLELASLYMLQEKYSQAEEMLKKLITINPTKLEAYRGLNLILRKKDIANKSLDTYDGVMDYYSKETKENFLRLRSILEQRKIRLLCAQYPMRPIDPLKAIFRNQADSIIFVDNQHIFEDALKTAPLREYFVDIFAGDFGHCTSKGNRLLAENIANAILKAVFNK